MKVKVCGLHPIRDVQLCIDLGINFLGFVFYDKSPRNLNLELVKKLKKYDKLNSYFTAVTVNPTDEFIKNVAVENFDYIQLHGSETSERINQIKSIGLKVIKTIKIKSQSDIENYKEYDNEWIKRIKPALEMYKVNGKYIIEPNKFIKHDAWNCLNRYHVKQILDSPPEYLELFNIKFNLICAARVKIYSNL